MNSGPGRIIARVRTWLRRKTIRTEFRPDDPASMRRFRFAAAALAMIASGLLAQTPVPLPPTPPRPDGDTGPTKVRFAFWLADITSIDSVAQTFSAGIVIVLRWSDPKLAHPGPGAKRFALDDIWYPEILIGNEAEAADISLPETADVAPDGTVVYRQRIVGAFSQSLNLRAFPFDHDTFRVRIIAPGHRPEDIEFLPDERAVAAGLRDGVGMADNLTLQDWRVTSIISRVEPYRITPGVEFAGFTVECAAARRAQHFVLKVILPLVLIVMMSWAVFWVEPTDTGSQIGVAVTAMLTLIAYRFAIDVYVPRLPYNTTLDAFVLMSSLLVFFSLIEVMVTTKLANRDRLGLARLIDRRCRWAFPLVFVAASAVIFFL